MHIAKFVSLQNKGCVISICPFFLNEIVMITYVVRLSKIFYNILLEEIDDAVGWFVTLFHKQYMRKNLIRTIKLPMIKILEKRRVI